MSSYRKVLIVGKPKSAGKTTLALRFPGKKLLLSFDLGAIPNVPGVDPGDVTVWSYSPAMPSISLDNDAWKRPKNVGKEILEDVIALRAAFVEGKPLIRGGVEIPKPEVIILDGLTELQAIVLDWILAVNNFTDPEDFENRFAAWGKRLNVIRSLLNMLIPLPAHVILITWETAETKATASGRGPVQTETGRWIPDIGGKLDTVVPGKVDAAVRCFPKYEDGKVSYWVQVQPDGLRDWIGVRGVYGGRKEIDVTLRDGKGLSGAQIVALFGASPEAAAK